MGSGELAPPLTWVAQEGRPLMAWMVASCPHLFQADPLGRVGPAPHPGSVGRQDSRQLAPPLVDATDRRAGPALCLGSAGELILVARHWKASPYDMGMGELALALTRRSTGAGELAPPLAWAEGMLALVV